MGTYFIRRIFIMIPTLFVISVVAFWLGRLAPGDPVECGNALAEMDDQKYQFYIEQYSNHFYQKGLDKPVFYFTLNSLAHPDTLQRIYPKTERQLCEKYIQLSANWPAIQKWRASVHILRRQFNEIKDDFDQDLSIAVNYELKMLLYADEFDRANLIYRNLEKMTLPSMLRTAIDQSKGDFEAISTNSARWKLWVPTLSWNGFSNQYHRWIVNMLKGDFGVSCRNSRPAVEIIGQSLKWTLLMTLPAIFLAFFLAIPLGIYSGLHAGSNFDRWSSILVFILHALPSFWVAILLLVFFTTPEYSRWLDWFPSIGLGRLPSTAPFWSRFWETSSHLILPIICMSYGSLALISRQMRAGVLNVLPQQYVLTARAKGLEKRQVTRRHILKNALFPILTLTAGILPGAISGSVIIEFIFNIPGMGRTTLDAILARDWPVVYAILFLGAGLTILGIFITDILYAWADPRVKFKSTLPDTE